MARKIGDPPVTRKGLERALEQSGQKLDQNLGSAIGVFRAEIKADISLLAVEMDRRFSLVASQASLDSLAAKIDRIWANFESRLSPL